MRRGIAVLLLIGCGETLSVDGPHDLAADFSSAADLREPELSLDLSSPDLTVLEVPDLAVEMDAAEPTDLTAAVVDLSAGDLKSVVQATARATSAVTGLVDVVAPGAVAVHIDYGATTVYGRSTPNFPMVNGVAEVPLLGLALADTNHLRVTVTYLDATTATSNDIELETPAPASPLPTINVGINNGSASGLVLLSTTKNGSLTDAASVLVDRSGKILWYHYNPPGTPRGIDSQRLANGRISIFRAPGWVFDEIDIAGRVARTWISPTADGADGHELLLLPNDNALLFGTNSVVVDGGTTLLHNTIEELHPDGGVVFQWDSRPEVGLDELADGFNPAASPVDLLHPNAIEVMPNGDLLAPFRHLDMVARIDRAQNQIAWRLGGKKNQFTFLDDPKNGFSRQHDIRRLSNGDLMLFDNGNTHSPPRSRVVVYRLDENAKTATLVWEYTHAPPIFTAFAGSSRRLANGNTLVTWAAQGIVTEINAAKDVVWEMTSSWTVYRGLPVPTLYP